MTTKMTDEQIREAAMKASRLEVERAPIASTELTDTELMLRLRRWKVADPADILVVQELTKDIAAAADRLAERNATLERVKVVQGRIRKDPRLNLPTQVVLEHLTEALARAQKEAAVIKPAIYDPVNDPEGAAKADAYLAAQPSSPVCEHLWENAPMRSAQRCEKCGTWRGNDARCEVCGAELHIAEDGIMRDENGYQHSWGHRMDRESPASPDAAPDGDPRCIDFQCQRLCLDCAKDKDHHTDENHSFTVHWHLGWAPPDAAPDAQREAHQKALRVLCEMWPLAPIDKLERFVDAILAAAKAGERR